jgi:hypothetical protein
VVADPLEAAGDEDHPQPPLAPLGVGAEFEQVVDDAPVRAVDQLVELEQRLRRHPVALLERAERDPDHLLGPLPHLLEAVEQCLVGREAVRQLRQLRDRDAEVAHPLEVEVVLQEREHEAEVARHRRLPRQQQLDALLDRDVLRVDVVVEGDHLVRQLEVARADGLDRAAQRAQDEVSLRVQGELQRVELLLEAEPRHVPGVAHPNLPVT